MKLKSQIVGLPVISIVEVASLGKVEDLVINPDTGSVDYLVVEPEQWYKERRLLAMQDVAGIGEDAITTETGTNVVSVSSQPAAIELLQKNIKIVGCPVMTKKGRLQGTVDEILVDEQTGKIAACHWTAGDNGNNGLIPANLVITYGKEMLVVAEDFAANLVQDMAGLPTAAVRQPAEEKVKLQASQDPLQFFEDKQKQYLIGRIVTTDILSDEGEIIAEQGQRVTQDMVDRAVAADKFVELTLNTRE
ncbi:PRC-barrel domain-containing protein [Desulforamulus hydrothermalis]|uniref:PRC-barrel domain protein n=1 Tax=Desulforamulus hydrothermalis Lam5 = DSM 18033 TaxID=1121428 RepID=K8DXR9_9FIRM|nr:PRC-barrel domain-containing protein [Desulforamulus hydrothermalis]CCO07424.1 PRC-barrel domain protein [Desulforamulus hydrothermalis Lam5 = DSM 18033]SHH35960.1 Uncharacterized protein YrrD, contains PRC-barrel domain [Desulforamulus hydrothermalis Lam5 = DSM 18033]